MFEFTILDVKKNFDFVKGDTIAKISLSDYYSILEKSKKMLYRVKKFYPEYWIYVIPYHDGDSFCPTIEKGKYKAVYFNGKLILQNPRSTGVNSHSNIELRIFDTEKYLDNHIAKISESDFIGLKKLTNYEIGCIKSKIPEVWVPVILPQDTYSIKGTHKFKLFNTELFLLDNDYSVDEKLPITKEAVSSFISENYTCPPHLFRCNADLKILFCEKCGKTKWI